MKLEWQAWLAGLRCCEHDFADRIDDADGDRQAASGALERVRVVMPLYR